MQNISLVSGLAMFMWLIILMVSCRSKGAPSSAALSGATLKDSNTINPLDDREFQIRNILQQKISSQSNGTIKLENFIKTNGIMKEIQGMKFYTLEWQADISIQQEIWKREGLKGYWENFFVETTQPSQLAVSLFKHYFKNSKIRFGGDANYIKTEQGWRLEQNEIKTEQTLSEGDAYLAVAKEKQTKELLAKHMVESRVPKEVIESINCSSKDFYNEPKMQNIILTDVNIEFNNQDGKKMKIWFGNIWNIAKVGGSNMAAINAHGTTDHSWIPFDTEQRRDQFITTLGTALREWKTRFPDVPHE